MSWSCWLGDTMTGLVDRPIDIPGFSWSVEVGDSSLSTSRDRSAGAEEWGGLTVPWSAVPGSTPEERSRSISTSRRSLALCWDRGDGSVGAPVLWGAVGARSDTWLDTSFSVDSVMAILSQRYALPELSFGTGPGSTSPTKVRLSGSWRSIACQLVRMCTGDKPFGALPIDLPYLGEPGANSLDMAAHDVGNTACSSLIEGISSRDGGPDVQFRPYMADSSHVRLRLVAGSDSDPFLGQPTVHSLSCFPGGGTIQDVEVDRAGPVMRVYATGSGTDAAQLCHASEDLGLCRATDPWPLAEMSLSDPDADDAASVAASADAAMAANRLPLVQVSGSVDFDDPGVPAPGEIWPGELVDVTLEGYPTVPDGTYRMRLMQMSGDQSSVARLKFDVMTDPAERT